MSGEKFSMPPDINSREDAESWANSLEGSKYFVATMISLNFLRKGAHEKSVYERARKEIETAPMTEDERLTCNNFLDEIIPKE